MKTTLRVLLVAATMLATARVASAQPRKFELQVSPRRASMDEVFFATVTIEVDGVSAADRYWAPKFIGFQLIDSRTDQNSSMRVDAKRGRTLVTQEIRRYQLKAKRPGNWFIEGARIRLGGKDYQTKGAYVVVTPSRAVVGPDQAVAGTRAPDPTASGGIGAPGYRPPDPAIRLATFLHPVTDKRTVYVGEQVTVTWLLFTRKEILKFEPRSQQVVGLWAEVLYEPKGFFKYHDTVVGTRPYQAVIVSKRALFPTKPGRLKVAPFSADVVSLGSALGRPTRVRSRSVFLRVKPLPKGAPDGFDNSYVGRFEVDAVADRDELEAGESFRLSLTIGGAGAIRRLTPPNLEIDGFEIRQPNDFKEKIDSKGNVVSGERVYEYWVTPRLGGPQTFPTVSIPYFDPQSEQYAVASSKPIPLLVRGDPSKLEDESKDSRDNLIARDIRLIHDGRQIDSRLLPTMYKRWWFTLLLGLPPLFFFLVLGIDRALRRLRRETPRARLRRARGNAKRRFRLAEIHLRGNRPNKFFGELSRVIYEHLEERLDRPLQAMTRDELSEVLKESGFARTTVERITRELDECDAARFSPVGASREEMRSALDKVKDILREIEKTPLASDREEAA
ncbi:MAG: BatD family protein [Deltaproteobacteria bacterium]|nr:BatD family protein [Deltaproteobacteria bacterium]